MDKIIGEQGIYWKSCEGKIRSSVLKMMIFKVAFRHAAEVSGKQMDIPVWNLGKRFELEMQNWELHTYR